MRVGRTIGMLRVLAAALLVVSVFAPLYAVPITFGGALGPVDTWDLVLDDLGTTGPLAIAFLGPTVVIVLLGTRRSRAWSTLLLVAELVFLGMSASAFFALAGSAFALLPILGPWLLGPAPGAAGAAVWLALAADGLLFVSCIARAGLELRAASSSLC